MLLNRSGIGRSLKLNWKLIILLGIVSVTVLGCPKTKVIYIDDCCQYLTECIDAADSLDKDLEKQLSTGS